MSDQSPYDVLGIPPDADDETLTAAYRERVKDAHPDQGGSVEQFQRVQAAYEEIVGGYADDHDGDDDGAGDTRSRDGTTTPRPGTRVEYLNYEVLDDHGWNLTDPDLFAKAADARLEEVDFGEFRVHARESLLEAAERRGYAWPFACRGGACANCAVYLVAGSMTTRVDHVLPAELVERGFQLSCNGIPTTPEMQVVYNVKNRPELEDLLLPPRPFEQAHVDD